MASTIKIKRSGLTDVPSALASGELAYSWKTGSDKLYIGWGNETQPGVADNIAVIGGKYFTDLLDHTAGTLTASSAIIVDANKKIDDLLVDNLELNGNTLSTTNTNGDLLLTPNGTGKTVITNPYVGDTSTSLAEYIYDTVGGAITAGTGITITSSDVGNTSTVSISDTGVATGTFGSTTTIPVLTINAQGQITTVTTASISTTLNVAGDTGTDAVSLASDTLSFVGGTGITSAVTNNTVTFDIDSTVVTLTGTQTLTNKSLSDSTTFFIDSTDESKKMQFELSGISAGTTRTLTVPNVSDTLAVIGTSQVFTAAQTFRAISSVRAETGLNQDAVVLAGRAGGVSGYAVSITPTTLTANRTLTLADGNTTLQAGTMAITGGTLAQFASTTSAQLAGVISDETGSGSLVFATSPTLVTPTLGVATATSINKVAFTAPATSATLTLADGSTLATSGAFSITLTSTAATNVTLPTTGTLATLAGAETLTNKTISGASNTLTNIGNSSLVNSSITFGSTTVSLGGTSTSLAGLTEVTVDNVNINGNTISATNTNGNVVLAPNGDGTVDVSGKRISGLATPTADTDAATKLYVDTVAAEGLHVQEGVDAATTDTLAVLSGGTVTYNNGTAGVGATLTTTGSFTTGNPFDGVALTLNPTKDPNGGGRVLVKNEANAAHNGIYYLINATTLERDPLFDSDPEIEGGDFVFVVEGTQNGGTGWVQTATVNIIGTDPIVWQQFSGAGTYTAGSGLVLTGTQFAVNLAPDDGLEFSGSNAIQIKGSIAGNGLSYASGVLTVGGTADRITVGADAVDIASTYAGQTSITTLGTIGTGTWQGTIVSPTYGGTGVNNGTKTITLGGNLTTSGAFASTFTMTAATSVTFPTTGTLATLAGSETLSNKTITNSSIGSVNPSTAAFTTLTASSNVTFTNTTDATALGTAPVVLSGGLSVAKKVYVGTNIVGSGAATSAIDGFTIDGGTY